MVRIARNTQGRENEPVPVVAPLGLRHLGFSDVDELAEALQGWGFDFRQLDRGRLQGEVRHVQSGGAQLSRFRFNRHFDQRGATPSGWRTFGFLEEGCSPLLWCGHEIAENTVFSFRSDGEFEAVSYPGFRAYALTFSNETLSHHAEDLGLGEEVFTPGESERVVVCDPGTARKLRNRLRRVFREMESCAAGRADDWLRGEIDEEIPGEFLRLFAQGREERSRPTARRRDQALKQAVAYIAEFGWQPIPVSELCRITAVSHWTLNDAFRERYGVSPKTYLQAVRLQHVRSELRHADPFATKVVDIANQWGFWHMGQFAADYRQMFGELPSQTLARLCR